MAWAVSDQPDAASAQAIIGLMHSSSLSKAVCVAAELGIADLLASGSMTVDELARRTQTHAPSLARLLRALACIGLCTETTEGSFKLTTSGALLRVGASGSLRSWVRWWGVYQWAAWGNLLYCVRTGESARKLATGSDGFAYLERDPQAAALFNDAMADMTRLIADEVVRAYDFAGTRRFADVGGGVGALTTAILQAKPGVRGMIFDRPHALEGAKACLASAGLSERCDLVAGDFFEFVPEGCDTYVLKSIIHDWDDDRSLAILRNCRRAMPRNGKILLIERAIPEDLGKSAFDRAIVCSDLAMLVGPGGRERGVSELSALLDAADIAVTRIVGSVFEYSLIEAAPR
jgi:hypothetical protein